MKGCSETLWYIFELSQNLFVNFFEGFFRYWCTSKSGINKAARPEVITRIRKTPVLNYSLWFSQNLSPSVSGRTGLEGQGNTKLAIFTYHQVSRIFVASFNIIWCVYNLIPIVLSIFLYNSPFSIENKYFLNICLPCGRTKGFEKVLLLSFKYIWCNSWNTTKTKILPNDEVWYLKKTAYIVLH